MYNKNVDTKGYNGRNAEVDFVNFMIGWAMYRKVKPSDIADFIVKAGVAVEVKTNAGTIGGYGVDTYTDRDECLDAIADDSYPMHHATYVAYAYGDDITAEDFIIVTRQVFRQAVKMFGVAEPAYLAGSRQPDGVDRYSVRLKDYRKKKTAPIMAAFYDYLVDHGTTVWEFRERYAADLEERYPRRG